MDADRIAENDSQKGLVVQIQGSSFVDGPGIRTTIFLKGCPLRCQWCCNPETQEFHPEENQLYPEKGTSKIFGKWLTVDEVMQVIVKDIRFYRSSGGGVTIAGGEPTFQPDFTLKLIQRCHELDIPVALDTCGYTVNQKAVMALESADVLLFDLKNMNPAEHARNTGVSNDRILANLKRLVELKKYIVIRVPLIPGYTDTQPNIVAIGDFLADLGAGSLKEVNLLAYHLGGLTKYEMLGRPYPLDKNLQPQSEEQLQKIKQTLVSILGEGCPVYFGG